MLVVSLRYLSPQVRGLRGIQDCSSPDWIPEPAWQATPQEHRGAHLRLHNEDCKETLFGVYAQVSFFSVLCVYFPMFFEGFCHVRELRNINRLDLSVADARSTFPNIGTLNIHYVGNLLISLILCTRKSCAFAVASGGPVFPKK